MGTISSILSTASSLASPVTDSTGTGSSTSTGTSTSSSSSSSSSTDYFAGMSTYSDDLQKVISRAVQIASLPISLLTAQQTTLDGQASELSTLNNDFAAIQTAIQGISDALSGSGMNTTVSNPAVGSVSLTDGAVQGAYSINVASIGSYASSLTSGNWDAGAGASGQTTSYNLVVGGNTYTFTPSSNSAATVASAINAQYGNLLQATVVNVGSSSSPDNRISLKSNKLGALDLDIQVGSGSNLQAAQAATTGNATSLTADTWDSSVTPSSFTLVVDGASYALNPADSSAASVAAAINALGGNPVQATVVNLGTADSPDERIQLQATSSSVSSVDLQDAEGNGLQQQEAPAAAGAAVSQTYATWNPSANASGDPVQYTLTAGGNRLSFTADDNNAASVAAAINALAGSPVTANVVDVGTAANPDYRLQLIDNTGSGAAPQLSANTPFSLQNQGPAGSLAQYEVANSGVTVTSDTRVVSIAAGTSLTLTGTGSTDVTVTQSASTLSSALSNFADAYNAAVGELAKQYGQSGGALQGQSIVYNLSQALASMSTYYSSASGSIGLADLGFTLNVDGTLSYSPLTMMGTDLGNSAGVIAFLGSATGGGFLQAATNAMNNVENAATGLLPTLTSSLQSQLSQLATTISDKQLSVQQLQTNLINEMSKADTAIEAMQQQYSYLTAMFSAQQTADLQYANE